MSNHMIFVIGIWGFACGWVASRPHHYKAFMKLLEDEVDQLVSKCNRTGKVEP